MASLPPAGFATGPAGPSPPRKQPSQPMAGNLWIKTKLQFRISATQNALSSPQNGIRADGALCAYGRRISHYVELVFQCLSTLLINREVSRTNLWQSTVAEI